MFSSIHSSSVDFGKAPTFVDISSEFLKSNKVGMPRTPKFVGVIGFSSILTLAIVNLPS